MKRFFCTCGQQAFFDSTECVKCGQRLGYDPEIAAMVTLEEVSDGVWLAGNDPTPGGRYRFCDNGLQYRVCNWLVSAGGHYLRCRACSLNRIIPCLEKAGNLRRWRALEVAKRRLIYTLLSLRLPVVSQWEDPQGGLLFDFLEDRRTNAEVAEGFVGTGHAGGVITINVLEADDTERESMREAMNEPYRTLLGHFRHESGHYFWSHYCESGGKIHEFRALFGDERVDYRRSLETYYLNGPADDWSRAYISPYASVHPLEDWSETWAHYLHMVDTLETAEGYGMVNLHAAEKGPSAWLDEWSELTLVLNELNRSMGLADAYPFVVSGPARRKLEFIHRVVNS